LTRRDKARLALDRLRAAIPRPETELDHGSPYELLVAVVLSAQCTDKRVNMVTPALFGAYPTVESMAAAEPEEVVEYIKSVTYLNQKSRALVAAAREIVSRFGGKVPRTMDELTSLPGVGRKSANVISAVAWQEPAIAVDTHVFRVANRIGLVRDAPTVRAVEDGLRRVIPRDGWIDAHHLLILHGRYTCHARRPECERCPLAAPAPGESRPPCDYYAGVLSLPAPLRGLDAKRGRYYAKATRRYLDDPVRRADRAGVEQLADPRSGSTDLYDTRTGKSTRVVRDYRVGGIGRRGREGGGMAEDG